jgi:hypothetical protein
MYRFVKTFWEIVANAIAVVGASFTVIVRLVGCLVIVPFAWPAYHFSF